MKTKKVSQKRREVHKETDRLEAAKKNLASMKKVYLPFVGKVEDWEPSKPDQWVSGYSFSNHISKD